MVLCERADSFWGFGALQRSAVDELSRPLLSRAISLNSEEIRWAKEIFERAGAEDKTSNLKHMQQFYRTGLRRA